ncbi:hypothetical protein [Desulfobacula sp.]|uniref:hypothetical protein n=1 Tax=Desulfobacula sp. TaxID=2593537 RepID=UPI00260652CD|nr:hypothetical protein [Desulfobacula sp.]
MCDHSIYNHQGKKDIGAHASAAGGVDKAPENAHCINATVFALFTKNQRRWQG